MKQAITMVFYFGPILFALGFLWPLFTQLITILGWALPFGVTPFYAGLILAGMLGLIAQIRGRWI